METPRIPKSVVLAFGGQTKKSVGMDRALYESCLPLRNYIEECDRIVIDLGHQTLLPSIFDPDPLTSAITLQCGTFAMQYACAKCWIDAGLRVEAMIGHSFGELTAMVVSGALSLPDGLKLIACRASLMETKWGEEKGIMLVIQSSRVIVQEIIDSINTDGIALDVEIACYNAPTSQVVVGSASAIDQTEKLLLTDPRYSGIRSQRLDVTHGFHSKFTEGILDDLDQHSASVTYRKPTIHLETCTAWTSEKLDANRFSRHARMPVYFSDAVQRIESRLGGCIWLEAGMNSPITQMIKSALATPDIHILHPVRLHTSKIPLATMCDITLDFWREGVPVSYWNFIASGKNDFKQIWLPPYEFQQTKHWLQHVDRAIEVQQNIAPERAAIEGNHTTLKPRQMLVCKTDDPKQFRVCLETERFLKIVTGHAVRQRPLCPASMYFESAAMAIHLLQGHVNIGALAFKDVSFQAALGIDQSREAFLTVDSLSNALGWSFVVKSRDSKARSSIHAKGKILHTEPSDFKTYERLIVDRIEELKKKHNVEKLMSSRAYRMFSRVVDYADFLQGISHIMLHETEALAEIDLSGKAEISFHQSTTIQQCEAVAIDTFIQVVGLLINSSQFVSSHDVYVATGVDNLSMSSACDFQKHKYWTVYAKYTSLGESQAVGDLFVMTREGIMAMMITGVQFTKLSISTLEKFLDSANANSPLDAVPEKKAFAAKDTEPSETSSSYVSSAASENSEITAASSLLSSTTGLQPDPQYSQVQESLFKLLSEASGASVASIEGKVTLRELGIDSLSAVELWDDLVKAFEVEIEDDRFTLNSTVQDIYDFLKHRDTPEEEGFSQATLVSMTTKQADSERNSKKAMSEEGFPNHRPPTADKEVTLANPVQALIQCQATFDKTASQQGFLSYWSKVASKQDELTLAYICEAFAAQGLDLNDIRQGQQVSMIHHLPKYAKLKNRLLDILVKHELLARHGDVLIRGSAQAPPRSSRQLHEQFIAELPAYKSEAQLMALTGPKLTDCLTGETDPVSLLFRDVAAQKVMEDYYCNSPMLSTLTEQMVSLVRELVKYDDSNSKQKPLQILEVGAGFGGTTSRLAEFLQKRGLPVLYKFTDISPSLVKGAKAKFGMYSWMEFQSLNLENDMPASLKEQYDIVIGTNCVHATTDRTKTICRLKSLLTHRGCIILSEVTQPIDWYDIVFGLLDGWWIANDGSTYPLQPPESWVSSFKQAGFNNRSVTYSSGSSRESNTQVLFVASNEQEVSKDGLSVEEDILPRMKTVVYKEVENISIEADIYLPRQVPSEAMPVGILVSPQ